MFKYCILLIVFSTSIIAQSWSYKDFDRYQKKISHKQISIRIFQYIQKHPQLSDHYSVTKTFFAIYASKEQKQIGQAEYILYLGPDLPQRQKSKSLKGLKVAIDPGHIGGPIFSRFEQRYISMQGQKDIEFHEGQLSVLTALHLKKLLEERGVIVMLTKDKAGQAVYHKDFFTWLEQDFIQAVKSRIAHLGKVEQNAKKCWWLTRAPISKVFRSLYNPLDLVARADKINAFAPDATIVIHYNAGGGNDDNGQNLGTKDNYNMAFVPGSIMRGELSNKRRRYEFLRLLCSNDLPMSLALSKEAVEQFATLLKVPIVDAKNPPAYLKNSCLDTGYPGVYARNLYLTRLVHSPICYGETLCQDNYKESVRLAKKDAVVAGIPTSKRVITIAQAYFNAIVKVYGKE